MRAARTETLMIVAEILVFDLRRFEEVSEITIWRGNLQPRNETGSMGIAESKNGNGGTKGERTGILDIPKLETELRKRLNAEILDVVIHIVLTRKCCLAFKFRLPSRFHSMGVRSKCHQ
jgi:hypothetical protein